MPTIRNTAGVDVICTNKSGTWHANLQVKCSRSRVSFWLISKEFGDWVGKNNYYVFVRYCPNEGGLEAFLVSSREVVRNAGQGLEYAKHKGAKWVPCFNPKNEDLNGLKDQWDQFGREFANERV